MPSAQDVVQRPGAGLQSNFSASVSVGAHLGCGLRPARPTEGCPAVVPWQARFEQHGLRGCDLRRITDFGYSKPLTNPLGLAVARQLKYRPIKTARPHVAAPFLRLKVRPGQRCLIPGASKRGLEGRGSRRYRHDAGQRHRPGHALAGARQGAVCEPADGASRHRLTVPACLR